MKESRTTVGKSKNTNSKTENQNVKKCWYSSEVGYYEKVISSIEDHEKRAWNRKHRQILQISSTWYTKNATKTNARA
jgi:hypothetical protein